MLVLALAYIIGLLLSEMNGAGFIAPILFIGKYFMTFSLHCFMQAHNRKCLSCSEVA